MNSRIYLLATLLVSPAWAQESAGFDLKSDAIKKIVRDAAATQFSYVQIAEKAVAKSEAAAFKYVPPEKPAPIREPPRQLPAKSPPPDGFIASAFGILVDELIGTDDYDDVTASNDILRCRVHKDLKISPPGVDRCPAAD
jgi:hypothetical protein